jgi:sugar lactone lactonase YvrE
MEMLAPCQQSGREMTRMNEVRTLLTGRGLVETPRWHDDRLYFSDGPRMRLSPSISPATAR